VFVEDAVGAAEQGRRQAMSLHKAEQHFKVRLPTLRETKSSPTYFTGGGINEGDQAAFGR